MAITMNDERDALMIVERRLPRMRYAAKLDRRRAHPA
jgi:hypothetical protein